MYYEPTRTVRCSAWHVAASSQTFHVNGDCGDDAWTGLSSSCVAPNGPKRTIQAAISAIGAESRIVVAPGTYLENVSVSPAFVSNLVIQSEAGAEETIIDGQGSGSAVGAGGVNGSSLVVRGFTLQNADWGLVNSFPLRAELYDCIVRDCVHGLRPADLVIAADTLFHDNDVAVEPFPSFERPFGRAELDRCVIRNNDVGALVAARTGGIAISNSLIVVNSGVAAVIVGPGIGVVMTLQNTTIARNAGPAIHCGNGSSFARLDVHNSVLWGNNNGGQQIRIFDSSIVLEDVRASIVQGGFPGAGNTNSDPLFADPSGGDFHLAAGSPGIDSGTAFLVPFALTADLERHPRIADDPAVANTGGPFPTYVDRGAYESGGTAYCRAISMTTETLSFPTWP